MPVIHRAYRLKFIVYVDDHEPAHVHVRGDGEARIAIDTATVQLLENKELSKSDLRRALDVVQMNRDLMLAQWRRIHG